PQPRIPDRGRDREGRDSGQGLHGRATATTVKALAGGWRRVRPDPEIDLEERDTVYRPSDDSYLLLGAVSVAPGERFLEVGAGAGLVALHAARVANTVATDMNPDAVELICENAWRNHVHLRVVRTDLMAGLRGPFDAV